MRLFGFRTEKAQQLDYKPAPSQSRASWENPLTSLFSAQNTFNWNLDFFDSLRKEIPWLDVVPIKWNRLIGDFTFTGDDKAVEYLTEFKKRMKIGQFDSGFQIWQHQMFDSAIAKGMGLGEQVPYASLRGTAYMKIANVNHLRFMQEDGQLVLGQYQDNVFLPVKFQNPDLIYYLTTDLRDGNPQGRSLFYSLPFVSQVLLRMIKAIDNTTWRIGDPSFVVQVRGGKAHQEAQTRKIASDIQGQLANVMKDRKRGQVRDVFTALPEDVTLEIGILGEGKFIENLEIPLNTIVDQIVAKSGLPHWMLGIRRSQGMNATLSETEADMLTADVHYYRGRIDPHIERIFETELIYQGMAGLDWKHEWNEISLRDDKAMSEARYYNAQAAEKEINNIVTMDSMGFFESEEQVFDQLRDLGLLKYIPSTEHYRKRLEAKLLDRIIKENEVQRMKDES